jgi:CIC family chloride channel protein
MHTICQIKKNIQLKTKLIIVSILISFYLLLGISLKKLTEHYEQIFYNQTTLHPLFIFVFPCLAYR